MSDTSKTHNTKVNRARQEMNLIKLIERYGDDDKCRAFLEKLRWPEGVRCPRCVSAKVSRVKARNQFDCDSCRYQFSATSGTVFHDTHLPLWKWFLAVYLMCESKKGMSANQLKRTLGIGSYKTAWHLCHRIRSAMHEADPEMLAGIVEADETYIGGKRKNVGHRAAFRNKTIVLGAIQRGGDVRLRVDRTGVAHTSAIAVETFLADVVADHAKAIFSDKSNLYDGVGDEDTRHDSVDHGKNEWVRGEVGTQGIESAWSLLKRSIVGSYHQLSAKHLPAYLDEFAFRFNNRENPFLFRDTLRALVCAEALTFQALVDGHPASN